MLYTHLMWVGSLLAVTTRSLVIKECLKSAHVLNVVLLEDEISLWSLKFVRDAVDRAMKIENHLNAEAGLNFKLTANYLGFNTSLYRRRGCASSACEGVEILKKLHVQNEVGCAMLGPSCTYATFHLVDFGLSCDFKAYLTRLLPPALKVSSFFVHFWHYMESSLKPRWETAYVYKRVEYSDSSEDCFWYINALEAASANFSSEIKRKVLRKPEEMRSALQQKNRTSNLFILCGTPKDVANLTDNGRHLDPEIVIILIDLYNPEYHSDLGSPAMKNVLVVTMPNMRNYSYGFKENGTDTLREINDYVAGYHDGVRLFGHVLREKMLLREETLTFNNPFRNVSFYGMGGHYVLDKYGDRETNFTVMYMSTVDNKYKVLFQLDSSTNLTKVVDDKPTWYWRGLRLPDDSPTVEEALAVQNIVVIVLGISVVVVTGIALIFYRRNIKDRQAQKQWSHIPPDRITTLENKDLSLVTLKIEEDHRKDCTYRIHRGRYDQKPIILKELENMDGCFNEKQKIELNSLLRIDYYNLTKFYGTVKFEHGVFGVVEFCERGSLRYVLNDKISYPEETFMDLEFKISVMHDIVKGMSYLHLSNIAVHGRLKSTNCVVDSRMVVKVTDFGCNTILRPGKDLWTAPEHLRDPGISQKGDVYSFGIIGQEILLRKCTFYTPACSSRKEKVCRVEFPESGSIFRPDLTLESAGERGQELCGLIKSCWDEDPEKRPDFKKIDSCLNKIICSLHGQGSESYMDRMIRRLQMYSRNLEHLVEERTVLYKAERDRADQLNCMLLPGPVVQSLKEHGCVEPELFDEVTIYFSDIVGFTTLCQYSTPMEVVDMLNDIYKNFDSILDNHDVYKVETIGDAYMVASGLPNRNGNRHAVDISCMALDILSFMGTFRLGHLPELPVWIRIGVHSGPCAAGVVGIKMPRYCLFGDTVNTASRMESAGLPLRIHVSQPTINILQRTDCKFEFETRGETYLKGRGTETTYWLTGVQGKEYNLPVPPTAENFKRQQQGLAQLIESCLEKRSPVSGRKIPRKTLSTRQRRRERDESQGDQQLEYLHLVDDLFTHM